MINKPEIDSVQLAWSEVVPRDPYVRLKIRRRTLYAGCGSIILHLALLFLVPQKTVGTGEEPENTSDSLLVNLRTPAAEASTKNASASAPEPPQRLDKRLPKATRTPPVIALSRENSAAETTVPERMVLPESPTATEKPVDMQTYVAAARARRRAAQGFDGEESQDSTGSDRGTSDDELRMEKVKRNLQSGTNGVFQILSMESRTAAFSFRGWTNDANNSRREYIQVDIGANSDIQIAVVRKMIELIRRYYKGYFNWESQRLDRTIRLSARTEDNEGLEEFLIKEFFGSAQGVRSIDQPRQARR